MSDTAVKYVGWHRANSSWQWSPVVGAEDEDTCWVRLLDATQRWPGGDRLVQRDPSPNDRKGRVFRKRCL